MGAIRVCNWGDVTQSWGVRKGLAENVTVEWDQRMIRQLLRERLGQGVRREKSSRQQEQQSQWCEGGGSMCWKGGSERSRCCQSQEQTLGSSPGWGTGGRRPVHTSLLGSEKQEDLPLCWPREAVNGYEARVGLFDQEQQLICGVLTSKSDLGTSGYLFLQSQYTRGSGEKNIFLTSGTRISLRDGTILE